MKSFTHPTRIATPLIRFATLGPLLALFLNCLPGGGPFLKGGYINGLQITPAATRIAGAPYDIVCHDAQEADRRKKEKLEEKAAREGRVLGPPVKYVSPETYSGGCEQTGSHSVFFLFNLFPITPRMRPEYAMALPVQRLGGDTMVNIRSWHEVHLYSLLGRVSVFKVRGDVVRFRIPKAEPVKKKNKRKRRR